MFASIGDPFLYSPLRDIVIAPLAAPSISSVIVGKRNRTTTLAAFRKEYFDLTSSVFSVRLADVAKLHLSRELRLRNQLNALMFIR